MIRERCARPQTDLISSLINVRDAERKLSEEELIGTCILLLIVGHETSVNMLGNDMFTLLRFPDQLELLKRYPEYLPSAIEEILRYESLFQQAAFRAVGETFAMNGAVIEKGQQITALLGAANRAPAHFPNPDRFDITRTPNRHLAFGIGIHFCLGAPLARLEGRVGFGRVLQKLPNMRLADEMRFRIGILTPACAGWHPWRWLCNCVLQRKIRRWRASLTRNLLETISIVSL